MPTLLFFGGTEVVVILVAVLLLFGANKLPEIARMLGKGMNEFKKATEDIKKEINENSGGVIEETKKLKNDIDSLKDDINKIT